MIHLQDVVKQFPGNPKPTLNQINLTINPGDFCVIIGANGCGKSTLLKIISRQMASDSGKVTTLSSISQVTQDMNNSTIAEMSVLENLALSTTQKPKFQFYHRFKNNMIALLEEVNLGLEQYIEQPMGLLSGGQKQIIATIMALHTGNKILLLDEHTSALDPNLQELLMHYTARKIKQYQITALMITHKMNDAIKYGNRLIMLNQGTIDLDVHEHEKKSFSTDHLRDKFQPQLQGVS